MAFRVPPVARAFGAIPETMGEAGLLLPSDVGPELAAEAIAEGLSNAGLRQTLQAAGNKQLARFAPDRARGTIVKHLLSVT
jgi:glycosyltransferase involved in cell wall biosynthesis